MIVEPLYTADEMRAAEEAFEGETLELMERAGTAAAEDDPRPLSGGALDLRSGAARARTAAMASWSRGSSGRRARTSTRGSSATSRRWPVTPPRNLRRAREAGIPFVDEPVEPDVVVDALFGTGFEGKPRQEAAEAIRGINDYGPPVVAVDLPSGVDASTGEVAGPAVRADADGDVPRAEGRPRGGARPFPRRGGRGRGHRPSRRDEPAQARVTAGILELVPRRAPGRQQVLGRSRSSSSAARRERPAPPASRRRRRSAPAPESARLRPRLAQSRLRAAPARGHDAAVPGRGRRHDHGRRRRDPRGARSARARSPSVRVSDELTGRARSSAICSTGSRSRSSSTPTGSGRSSATSTGSSSATRRPCSPRTRASSPPSWAGSRTGCGRAGCTPCRPARTTSAPSSSSRAPTRSWPRPDAASPRRGPRAIRVSRRRARATSLRASSPPSWPRGWTRERRRRPRRSRRVSQRTSRPSGTGTPASSLGDLVDALSPALSGRRPAS